MVTYICSFLLIYVCGFFCKHAISRNEKSKRNRIIFFLVIAWLILSIVEGLRAYSVGTDTPVYVRYFTTMPQLDIELGFWWLMKTVRYITGNPSVFLLVCALITNGLFIYAIYKISSDCYYSIFVFITQMFYFISYNAIRQSIAISLIMVAYYHIRNRNLKAFFILVILASCFHTSAIIGLLYVPIYLYRNCVIVENERFGRDIMEFIVTCLLVFIGYYLLENEIQLFGAIFPQYAHYIHSKYVLISGGIQRPLVNSAIYLCLIFFTNSSVERRMYSLPLSVAVMFAFMSLRISAISRFMWYFDMISIFTLPYIFKNLRFDGVTKKIIKFIITVVLIIYMLYNLRTGYMRVDKYSFFWQ